jgi:hypothetical protein
MLNMFNNPRSIKDMVGIRPWCDMVNRLSEAVIKMWNEEKLLQTTPDTSPDTSCEAATERQTVLAKQLQIIR